MNLIQLTGKLKGRKIVFIEYPLQIKKVNEEEYVIQMGHLVKKSDIGQIKPFADAFNGYKTSYQVVINAEEVSDYKEKISELIKTELREEKEDIEKTLTALESN